MAKEGATGRVVLLPLPMLRCRFSNRQIYTALGNILIALNPFELLEEVYTPELLLKYQAKYSDAAAPDAEPAVSSVVEVGNRMFTASLCSAMRANSPSPMRPSSLSWSTKRICR